MLALLMIPFAVNAAIEETFDVLQIGSHTYKNVTVTTKAKSYIFILHSAGMNNVKVADLPAEIRDRLGYNKVTDPAQAGSNGVSGWAKHTMARIESPEIKQLEAALRTGSLHAGMNGSVDAGNLWSALVVFGALYFIFSYCALLICRKTGNDGGVLVFIPILQMIPLLRAAGMSPGWLVVFLVPFINIVAWIAWAINIAEARGKSGWVALFLILPGSNFLAFLYLALSNGTPERREDRRSEIMTLETA